MSLLNEAPVVELGQVDHGHKRVHGGQEHSETFKFNCTIEFYMALVEVCGVLCEN